MTNIKSNIRASNIDPVANLRPKQSGTGVTFSEWTDVTEAKVLSIIKASKDSNSPDVYGMSDSLFKKVNIAILSPLTWVIILCLADSYFPDVLKNTKTVTIFKKGK